MTLPLNLLNPESVSYASNRENLSSVPVRARVIRVARRRAWRSVSRANTLAVGNHPPPRSRASASSTGRLVRAKPSTHRLRVRPRTRRSAHDLSRRVVSKQRHQPHAQRHGDGHRDDDGTHGARDHPSRRAIEDLARARAFAGRDGMVASRGDASTNARWTDGWRRMGTEGLATGRFVVFGMGTPARPHID